MNVTSLPSQTITSVWHDAHYVNLALTPLKKQLRWSQPWLKQRQLSRGQRCLSSFWSGRVTAERVFGSVWNTLQLRWKKEIARWEAEPCPWTFALADFFIHMTNWFTPATSSSSHPCMWCAHVRRAKKLQPSAHTSGRHEWLVTVNAMSGFLRIERTRPYQRIEGRRLAHQKQSIVANCKENKRHWRRQKKVVQEVGLQERRTNEEGAAGALEWMSGP